MDARKLLLLNRSRWLRDIASGEMLAWYRGNIADGKLVAYLPRAGSSTVQVKGSAFTGAGTGACTGLLTTDTITSSGTAPTCSVNGTLTIGGTCWDIYVHRSGVLWAYWPGINVGGSFELDASGNGHHLYLTDTTIVEVLDGTGTNWCNEMGFTVADGSQYLADDGVDAIGAGWRIPALVDGSGCAAYVVTGERAPITTPGPLNVSATITAGTTYPDITIKAPLGPEFQAIAEWTGEAAVDLTSWTGSDQTRIGPRGMFIYDQPLTYADAVRADRYLGYSIPAEVVHLWNAKEPTTAGIGPQPVYSAASTQPDADGNLVTWPNYVPGRGVEVHPAYTNLIQNSKFIGAVSGSPGTPPTNWALVVNVGDGGMSVVPYTGGNALRFTCSGDRLGYAHTIAGSANTVYTAFVTAQCDGILSIVNMFIPAAVPVGTTTVYTVDGVAANTSTIPSAGTHEIRAVTTVGATAGDIIYRMGVGISAAVTGQATFSRPQIVASAYQLPYVASGPNSTASVASTAATSAGNGLAIPLDARMTAALSGIFTAGALVKMQASSAEITADTNILAFSDAVTGGIYAAAGGIFKATDGTNTATVTVAGGWARGEAPLICLWINGAGTQMQVGYKKAAESTITWGAAANYDGSFGPGTHMRWGYTSGVPFGAIQSQLWAESVGTDAEILSLMRYAS